MRRPKQGTRELVIIRREAFTTRGSESEWTGEVTSFRRELGILQWQPEHGATPDGKPKVTFRETVQTLNFFAEE
jgi:hypothetical protein